MEQQLFRKKSIERISSPEQLGDYLRVTSPSVWVVLAAVILLLASLFIWCYVTTVESYADGMAQVRNGLLTLTFDDGEKAKNVEVGMDISVGDLEAPILSIGRDDGGRFLAAANVNLPDGYYEARVAYRSTTVIEMLFAEGWRQ